MSIRFLADEDINTAVIEGLRHREPLIDILDAKDPDLRSKADAELLELAAQQGRIVITHDRRTMIRHYRERLADWGVESGAVRGFTTSGSRRNRRVAGPDMERVQTGGVAR